MIQGDQVVTIFTEMVQKTNMEQKQYFKIRF